MAFRTLSLERRLLLLVIIPLLGAALPAGLMLWQAQKDLAEMRNLKALAELVWKLGDLEGSLDSEASNWYFFKPTWQCTDEVRRAERQKQDQWRQETDRAIVAYNQQRAAVDASILSPTLQAAIDSVASRIGALPALRKMVDTQMDETSSNPIMDGYRDFRRDIDQVLPLLVDATSSHSITRKLVVLPKVMLVRKTAMEAGGMIFYFHQLRASKARSFNTNEAYTLKQAADTTELLWTDIIALSEGQTREHLAAIHASDEWKFVVDMLRKHSESALNGTPPPIPDEKPWGVGWSFLETGMANEIKILR
jgi:hypothetical protein